MESFSSHYIKLALLSKTTCVLDSSSFIVYITEVLIVCNLFDYFHYYILGPFIVYCIINLLHIIHYIYYTALLYNNVGI